MVIFEKIGKLSLSDQILSPFNQVEMWFSVFLIGFLLWKEHYFEKIPTANTVVFFILFPLIAFMTYFLGVITENQFIYFQF